MENGGKKIIFWINGKDEESTFEIKISEDINTIKRLKDIIFYEKNIKGVIAMKGTKRISDLITT